MPTSPRRWAPWSAGTSWSLAFQSRLGPVEWLRPYLEDKLAAVDGEIRVLAHPRAEESIRGLLEDSRSTPHTPPKDTH